MAERAIGARSDAARSDAARSDAARSDARVIALVSTGHFVSHLYTLILPPLFVLIRGEYGVSYAELGIPIAVFNIVSAALQTPAGFIVDRFGAGKMLVAALVLWSGTVALAGILPSFWGLVAMFALAGLANTVFHPADYAILSQACSPARVGQAFSIHTFSGLLGWAAAPAAMLFLAGELGWRGALVAIAVPGFAAALLLFLGRAAFAEPAAPRQVAAKAEAAVGWKLLLSGPILGNLVFFFLIALAGAGLSNFSVVAFGALYGTAFGTANLALSAFLFMSAVGVLLGGVIADRTRRHHQVAALGFAGSGAAVIVLGNIDVGSVLLVTLMAVGGLLNGIIMPSRDMIVRAVTPQGAFGKVFGFVSTGFNIGGIAAPLLFGWLMDAGHPRAVFLVVAAAIALSLLTVLRRAPRRVAAAQPAE